MGDMEILSGLVIFFMTLAIITPLINSSAPTNSTDSIDPRNVDSSGWDFTDLPTIIQIFLNLLVMPVWSFGQLPVILDLFLLIPRVIFLWIAVRMIRGVG